MSLDVSFPTAKAAVFGLFLQRSEMGPGGGPETSVGSGAAEVRHPECIAREVVGWESGVGSKDLG